MAVPLTRYLEESAVYEGFDVVPEGIDWCKQAITSRHPNFRFQVADLFNKQYNPGGRFNASEYEFPYGDSEFDFVFLGSVFTHLLPDDMVNYTREISRVLARGGTAFITYFLLNGESRDLIADGTSTLDFRYERDGYHTIDEAVPERAVAYDEQYVSRLLGDSDLQVVEPIQYGSWAGRTDYFSGQDIVLARKS
jgi:SAM-dependent methyltransferase